MARKRTERRRHPATDRFRDLKRGQAAYLLAVEATALVVTVVLAGYRIGGHDVRMAAILTGWAIFTAEITRRTENMRRRITHSPHVNLTSVWVSAAAVTVPPVLAAGVVLIMYVHLRVRAWRASSPLYKFVFNVCMIMLAAYVTGAVARLLDFQSRPAHLLPMVAAVAAYAVTNTALVGGALALVRSERSWRGVLGAWSENCVEVGTLCLGMVAAVLVANMPNVLFMLPLPLYAVHRAALIRQIKDDATRDKESGLHNTATWRAMLDRLVEQAVARSTSLGVVLIGVAPVPHGPGQPPERDNRQWVRVVGDAIREEVRDSDPCGRYTSGEFVVALPGADLDDAASVADRIRDRIRGLVLAGCGRPVTVSIGVAALPNAGRDVMALLTAVNSALFAAKDAGLDGRDRVEIARVDGPPAGR